LVKFPWSRGSGNDAPTFKPLEINAGYVLEVEGYNAVALKLSGKVVNDIAQQEPQPGAKGMLAKLKAKFVTSEADQEWLIVTNVRNTMLEDYDRFAGLIAQALTSASGEPVSTSNLAISASIRITGNGQRMEETLEQAPNFT
jgi:hypothetical protein